MKLEFRLRGLNTTHKKTDVNKYPYVFVDACLPDETHSLTEYRGYPEATYTVCFYTTILPKLGAYQDLFYWTYYKLEKL